MNFNLFKVFAENVSAFLTKSIHLNSERKLHAKETLEPNLSHDDLTSTEEQSHNLRRQDPNRLICAHLNINYLRNKLNLLANIVKDKIYILMISETKIDSSFPKEQFHIHGFSEPYRLEENGNGVGILVFIRENIPSKPIESQMRIKDSLLN